MTRCVTVLLILLFCALLPGCGTPLVVTVEAQSLPIDRTVAWDANAASDGVTHYTVTLDATLVGSPTGLTQVVTFASAGSHTIQLRAVNGWGASAPATLTVNVVVPASPANLRLQ